MFLYPENKASFGLLLMKDFATKILESQLNEKDSTTAGFEPARETP